MSGVSMAGDGSSWPPEVLEVVGTCVVELHLMGVDGGGCS